MRYLVKKYFAITLLFLLTINSLYSQVGTYTKVDKIYRNTYNFLETENTRQKQYKDKSVYLVYSDREDNQAYLDVLGLKDGEKQKFLTPYFVINETDDYYELVKSDASLLGKPKGIFSVFYGDKYNFQDAKNVEYIGWIKKDKLLLFSHPKISEENLYPLTYYLGVKDGETLLSLKKFIKNDTVFTYKDPNFKIKSEKPFLTNQFVYLYKYDSNKNAALISDKSNLVLSDSLERKMGWVPAALITNIGQRQVWKNTKNKNVFVQGKENKSEEIDFRDIKNEIIFQSNEKKIDSLASNVFLPLNVWSHHDNKLINVKGESFYLREVPFIKKGQETFNFHFVYDCSPKLKKKLLMQIIALQQMWLVLSEDTRYKDKKVTFSAHSFGCNSCSELPKTDSFAVWIDFLQNNLLEEKPSGNKGNLTLSSCLESIVNQNQFEELSFENNIVMVFGEDQLDFNIEENDALLYELAKISSRLLFFQLENSSDDNHQDYILKSKQILDATSDYFTDYFSNYIIDSKAVFDKNIYTSINTEDNIIYLYDAPKKSIYTGGLVFPKTDYTLSSESLSIALVSVVSKTMEANISLLKSLETGADKLGFLRSKPSVSIANILTGEYQVENLALIPKNDKNEIYLDSKKMNVVYPNKPEAGYLLTKNELENIIEGYKSIIPIADTITKKERKLLRKKYKGYYKELNKILFYKELKKSNTAGKLIEIRTGIKVSDKTLNALKIADVSNDKKIPNPDFTKLMILLRQKITALENTLSNPSAEQFKYGDSKFYYITQRELL